MARYRLYFLGREGRIVAVEELDCDDDEAAILDAQKHAGDAMELWDRARMVKVFEPSDATARRV